MAKEKQSKKVSKQVELNIDELKPFLGHIISNNRWLQERGKPPVSVEVCGESGIGKTSSVVQLADELGLSFVKLNLAQIEELGDLVGFPIRQFEMKDTSGKSEWVDEQMVEDYRKQGFDGTGNNRMSYCPPEWIANKTNGGILLLDDWNRADTRFIQAVMELIDRQQYISWKLPKDWHILLTSNPDNGEYMVQSIDTAQRTRFVSVNLKFDKDVWAKWAEENQLDGRCINFLLMHPELVNKEVNARSIVTFFNSISSLPSFEASLPLIQMIGEGSVGTEFSTLFTIFINNKLDKMISPHDILFKDEKYVLDTLKGLVGDPSKDSYRADIAATLSIRLINYSLFYANDNSKNIDKAFVDRISKIITEKLFTTDICYNIVKMIYNGNQAKFKAFTMNNALVKYIMK